MSESENQTEEKKKSPLVIILLIALLAVLGIGILNNLNKSKDSGEDKSAIETADMHKGHDHAEIKPTEDTPKSVIDDMVNAIKQTASDATNTKGFSLEDAIKPRILGNPDAPIKISEHSSFTCGHCAKFHKTNFKKIKADYIDTGKAYIVYNDFPLNAHDVNIGAIARCVPEKSYFQFVQLLFETQKDWLKEDYISHVKQNAKLTGVSEEQINNCFDSEELREALANQRQTAMDNHGVKATPTLVINDSVVIMGMSDYSELKKALDAELEKAAK